MIAGKMAQWRWQGKSAMREEYRREARGQEAGAFETDGVAAAAAPPCHVSVKRCRRCCSYAEHAAIITCLLARVMMLYASARRGGGFRAMLRAVRGDVSLLYACRRYAA